jgi:hypothetical protein
MKNDGLIKIVIAIVVGFILLKTCSTVTKSKRTTTSSSVAKDWKKSPVDNLIKELSSERNFSIILYDMDVKNQDSRNPDYQHQYQVIKELSDTVIAEDTDWYPVSESFFQQNIDNMGMEIASKNDGVVEKQAAPAGYSNYVGNPKYGQWQQRNGNSFWEFYGRYAFMSSMFNLMTYPARRDYWNDYRNNYRSTGRGYYGPSGQTIYGTKSYTSSNSGRNTQWGNKSSNFKTNVRNRVSRSSSASSSRSYSSSSSYNKTTRSSTRSYGSTSYRSRSGGYGK